MIIASSGIYLIWGRAFYTARRLTPPHHALGGMVNLHSVNVGNVRLVPVGGRGIRSKLQGDKGEKGHVRSVAALCNFRI